MRDCIFLLADKNMEAAFSGFLSREKYHDSLECGFFDFDTQLDIKVAAGDNDPGLFTRGHELLRPYQQSHQRAIVVLDAAWKGSPGSDEIKQQLTENIRKTGWQEATFQVIVIDPELENWIWQRSDHVARGLGYRDAGELLSQDIVLKAWPNGQSKPTDPKETLEAVLRKKRIPRSSAIYRNITSKVSVRNCEDTGFQEMMTVLQMWFPAPGK